jgi:hypothetical protein
MQRSGSLVCEYKVDEPDLLGCDQSVAANGRGGVLAFQAKSVSRNQFLQSSAVTYSDPKV